MGWCYHHCRAFVMTSRLEACPNVALEAMAHGCAIVSTDNPPMPEMFGASGETAEFYPAGTAEALAERLVAMAEWTPETRAERCEAARRRAAQFSWPAAAQKTVDELQRAISAQRR
jgi:glycosyltransferase involved in cell wall biosynthesis